ncbi:Methyl-accepting chemotaxis protein 2 [Fundidesulfovibrio magnetotacticus]|uniref:Methyl-accepting chemotaxis protein 2 n=1 Tax=Fundidesulfovibrio magnetotacticus TaxID=2730080 RepID=A0A6V8LXV3_9BACT|nr:methyl-accepting chemotaxis protein [Fundidesulfovibrio magnetotacticus]GFK93105.1 Methyl-accepting chemotaxis protein 2 [Fundidesulfovibrio magnetotacticus]
MIAWWRELKLSGKLTLCCSSFLVPIALLLFLLLGQMARDLRLARVELAGVAALDPLEDIAEAVPNYVKLVIDRMGGADVSASLAQLDIVLADRWAELSKRLNRDADCLGLTPDKLAPLGLSHLEPAAFVKAAADIARAPASSPEQAVAAQVQFMAMLTELREYIADSAQLVLDPELATYYLMYLLVFDIPRAQERLGLLLNSGQIALSKLPGAEGERAKMATVSAAWEQSVVERILDKLGKAQRAMGGDRLAGLPKAVNAYAEASRAFLRVSKSVTAREASMNLETYSRAGEAALKAGAELWDQCYAQFRGLLEERLRHLRLHFGVALGVSLASILGAGLLAWGIATSIARPIARVARIATTIADGKVAQASALLEASCPSGSCSAERLRASRASNSETSQLFAAVAVMIHSLENLLAAVNATGEQLQASAGRIAATARQIEASATQQAASTVEVGATSKEISATAANLADTMGEVLGLANRSSSLAVEGRESLTLMDDAMLGLSQASRDMSSKLSLIREKASGIGQLLSTIAKVATQTNLLSLNAAIEAEKAGEFGRGFAVVAREIRRLADQTASAALDIERTVRDMQASVQAGAGAMDGFRGLADQTAETSQGVNTRLGRIIESGEALTPRFSTVTEGMRAQAEGADQISVVIAQLADAAGETRDSLAEFRQAAEDLTATAAGLKDILARFELER